MSPKKSLYKQYEDELGNYYGAQNDLLAFPPPVRNPEIAHALALQVESYINQIDEADLAASAARGLLREMPRQRTPERRAQLIDEARADRLRMAVVNVEMTHAQLAPGDFNPDQEQAGAYGMGIGIVLPPRHNP
jgi:hypothetical protein